MRKNGCLPLVVIGAVCWYGVFMTFIDIRVWIGCIAGVLASALCVYPNVSHLSDGLWYKKAISAYIVGVAVALLVNKLMLLGTVLLFVSPFIILLVVPAAILLVAVMHED